MLEIVVPLALILLIVLSLLTLAQGPRLEKAIRDNKPVADKGIEERHRALIDYFDLIRRNQESADARIVNVSRRQENVHQLRVALRGYEESHARYQEQSINGFAHKERIACGCEHCQKAQEILSA